jgi:peptidoglycan hydrolase-like protein with peptidoglycan-binding domain
MLPRLSGSGSKNPRKSLKVPDSAGRYPTVLVTLPASARSIRPRPARRVLAGVVLASLPLVSVIGGSPVQAHGVPAATSAHARAFATPHMPANTRTSTLPRLGDRGESVRKLQRALIAAGVNVRGGADGVFGQSTSAAVKTFQSAKGLIASGDIDPSTAFLLGLGPSPVFPKRGDRGVAVTALQNALVAAGISVRGGVDGVFGSGTAAAISAFQTSRGMTATGAIDITTAIALGVAPASATPTTAPTTTAPVTTSPATTSPATTAPTTVFATVGQSGPAVVTLQRALIAAGITVRGGADGVFGPATTNAIISYQRAISVSATGQLDNTTAQFLGLVPAPSLPKFGDRGPGVTDVQNKLLTNGITVKGGADGVFGVATRISLRAFQTARRIPVTGTVDLPTALRLGIIPGFVDGATSGTPAPTSTSAPTSSTVPVTTTSISVFPVLGPCWFSDTWQVPRAGGRRHEGVDIIAKTGQPLYAVVDGTITRQFFDRPGSLGGNALRLTASDGTYFHYAHLSAFAEGVGLDSKVVAGQVIGYVGSTGSSSAPHLHFEYHPGGGAAVNPYPIVKAVDGCRSTTPPTTATTTVAPTTTSVPSA